jgi:hypothetical protein
LGLGDILFGRRKLKEPSPDQLFALSTARITMEVDLGLKPAGRAGVCFKPLSGGDFARAESDLQDLLAATSGDTGTRIRLEGDDHGFQWIVLEDPDLEDLVTTVHVVSSELIARGFGPQLLAALFRFEKGGETAYWIYAYKRGAFYPFVPKGAEDRDNARELELKAQLERELPLEQDLTRWFALYGAPV